MLLAQWFSWWGTIPELEAGERLSAYTTALLADSGWKMERDEILEEWRAMAAGRSQQQALSTVPYDPQDPDANDKFLAQVYRVQNWLAINFGRASING